MSTKDAKQKGKEFVEYDQDDEEEAEDEEFEGFGKPTTKNPIASGNFG